MHKIMIQRVLTKVTLRRDKVLFVYIKHSINHPLSAWILTMNAGDSLKT